MEPYPYTRSVSQNSGSPDFGTYVEFDSVTPVAGKITLTVVYSGNGEDGFGVTALQLTQVP